MHPVSTVLGGPVLYPIEKTSEVLRFFRDYIATAPEDLGAVFAFLIAPAAPFIKTAAWTPISVHGAGGNAARAALPPCLSFPLLTFHTVCAII